MRAVSQTVALFVDEYRSLRAKRLFWIVLGLSLVFVAAMACITNNEDGIQVLVWTIPFEFLSTDVVPRAEFMRLVFLSLGFSIWLSWAATILALISTSSIMPDFVSGGAIELTLSRPIGRFRLYLTKYATGLLFVALQVTIFALGSFLAIGARGGGWDPRLLLAIPAVVVFFSYLYAVSALIGLLTRSAITALMLTILLWLVNFMIHAAEAGVLLQFRVGRDLVVTALEADIKAREVELEGLASAPEGETPEQAEARATRAGALRDSIASRKEELVEDEASARTLRRVHAILYGVKTVLPKTSETMELVGRWVMSAETMDRLAGGPAEGGSPPLRSSKGSVRVSQRTVQREAQKELQSRSVWWVMGTSLAFEFVLVSAGAVIFVRRDF